MGDFGWTIWLVFMCGVGLGIVISILAMIIIKKIVMSNVANTPDMQKLMRCLAQCSQKGFAFGSPEYNDCINRCLNEKTG